jgi:hypothetical protein
MFVNGQRHGEGVYVASAGHRCTRGSGEDSPADVCFLADEGTWQNDMRHGAGTQTYAAKGTGAAAASNVSLGFTIQHLLARLLYLFRQWAGTYEGEWQENKKHGRGIFTYLTGDRCATLGAMPASILENSLSASCACCSYEGQWVRDKKDGYGIYTYKSKDRYEGQFSMGDMHGRGIYIYANGTQLVGTWSAGCRLVAAHCACACCACACCACACCACACCAMPAIAPDRGACVLAFQRCALALPILTVACFEQEKRRSGRAGVDYDSRGKEARRVLGQWRAR